MTMKKLSIICAAVVIPIVILGVIFGTTDFMKEDVEKNQALLLPEIHNIRTTNDIKDIKDDVVYTILGTISSVGYDDELIEWNT